MCIVHPFVLIKLNEWLIYFLHSRDECGVKGMNRLCMNEFASDPLPFDLNKQKGRCNVHIWVCERELLEDTWRWDASQTCSYDMSVANWNTKIQSREKNLFLYIQTCNHKNTGNNTETPTRHAAQGMSLCQMVAMLKVRLLILCSDARAADYKTLWDSFGGFLLLLLRTNIPWPLNKQ